MDAKRIEEIESVCEIMAQTGTLNIAVHKDDPETAHLWLGADTACRRIIGGQKFKDFEIGLGRRHRCPNHYQQCKKASPNNLLARYIRSGKLERERVDAAETRWFRILAAVSTLPGIVIGFRDDLFIGIVFAISFPAFTFPFAGITSEILKKSLLRKDEDLAWIAGLSVMTIVAVLFAIFMMFSPSDRF